MIDDLWFAIPMISAGVAIAHNPRAIRRLATPRCDGSSRNGCGIAAFISTVCASLRSGGTVWMSMERFADHPFAVREMTVSRVARVMERVRAREESRAHVLTVSREFVAACRLSDLSGCEEMRCLNVVADDYRRLRMMEDLRRNAFAMPLATVRLLLALPLVTMVLGVVLGADPVSFLLGTAGGMTCLVLGLTCYLIGLEWIRVLLRHTSVPYVGEP